MTRISRPLLVLAGVALLLGLLTVSSRKHAGPARPAAAKAKAQPALIGLLPPGVKTALWLDVGRLHAAPAAAALRDAFWSGDRVEGIARFKEATQLDLRNDLEELVAAGDAGNPDSLLLIGRGRFDTSALDKALRQFPQVEATDYKGAALFRLPQPKNKVECIAVLGPRELAAGALAGVKGMLDYREAAQAGQAPASPIQQQLLAAGDGAVARMVTTQLAEFPKVKAGPFKERTKLAALAASITSDTEAQVTVRLDLDEAEFAGQAKELLNDALTGARTAMEKQGRTIKGFDRFADSLRVERKDASLNATARVPAELIASMMELQGGRRSEASAPPAAPAAGEARDPRTALDRFVALVNQCDGAGVSAMMANPFYADDKPVEGAQDRAALIEKLTNPDHPQVVLVQASPVSASEAGLPPEAGGVLTADDTLLDVVLQVGAQTERRVVAVRKTGDSFKILAFSKNRSQ